MRLLISERADTIRVGDRIHTDTGDLEVLGCGRVNGVAGIRLEVSVPQMSGRDVAELRLQPHELVAVWRVRAA